MRYEAERTADFQLQGLCIYAVKLLGKNLLRKKSETLFRIDFFLQSSKTKFEPGFMLKDSSQHKTTDHIFSDQSRASTTH